ncbi:MAG: VOC family protein [Hyphomicrobiaceae bacterium]
MDWYIHHINTPAMDVRRTANFLRKIVGMIDGTWTYPETAGELHHRDDTIAYFGSDNRGVHVVKPIPTFAQDNNLIHNPTVGGHVAITVSDLDAVVSRLKAADIPYSDAGTYAMAGVHQIYFYDPSMNVIEINQVVADTGGKPPRPREKHDIRWEPGDWYIHHVNLPAHDVPQTAAFFRDVVGLEQDEWSYPPGQPVNFRHDPEHLAVFGDDNRGLHVVKPSADFAYNNGFMHNPTIGGHYAITVRDLDVVKARLEQAGTLFTEAGIYAMSGVRQIYVFDPEARFVEINQVT